MAEDFSQWPTKQEARQQLGGVPERTFDRWLSEHNIKVAYRKVTGRRPVPVVDPAGMALLQREMVPQGAVPLAVHSATEVAARSAISPQWREMAAAFFSSLPTAPRALFLTLEQAVEYSGLSRTLLKRLIAEGKIPAWKDHGYKISRKVLDAVAEWQQNGQVRGDGKKSKR